MNVGAADSGCIPADADGCVHQGSMKERVGGEGKIVKRDRRRGRKGGRKQEGNKLVTMLTTLFSLG